MRAVDYSDVLKGSAALAGLGPTDIGTGEFALLKTFHDRRLQSAWECHRWPETTRVEQRFFQAGTFGRYIPWVTDDTVTAGVVNGTVGLASGQSVGTVSGLALGYVPLRAVVSVRTTSGGLALFAMVVDGTLSADGFQFILSGLTDSANYKLDYALYGAIATEVVGPSGSFAIGNGVSSGDVTGLALGFVPDQVLVGVRSPSGGLVMFASVVDSSVSADGFSFVLSGMTDASGYYLDYLLVGGQQGLTSIGEFLRATDKDPRTTTKVVELPFEIREEGAYFPQARQTTTSVWLEFQTRRPELIGEVWDSATVYASGRQVYFVDSTSVGNFWTSNAATTAGQSPSTTPSKWDVVELPYRFRSYLIQAGYADWLTADGQASKAAVQEGMAMGYLEMEVDKLQRQGGQVRRFKWAA